MDQIDYDFDLFIIGGGTGGLSAAKWAATSGVRVGLAEFGQQLSQGHQWGLGGYCVNAGCIPKKIMHYASLLGEDLRMKQKLGWQNHIKIQHSWEKMQIKIKDFIKQFNMCYKSSLQKDYVTYYKRVHKLKNNHEIQLIDNKNSRVVISSRYILITSQGRAKYPEIEGARYYGITSDDLFWTQRKPGKTLIVGGSEIGLQCAGLLNGFGIDVTIISKSQILKRFDQQIAQKIILYLQKLGVKFIINSTLIKIIAGSNINQTKIAHYKTFKHQTIITEEFDTIIFCVGRTFDTKSLRINQIGIRTSSSGKIIVEEDDSTTISNIYAIGDIVQGRSQLCHSVIMAGKLLAKRLFRNEKSLMSYRYVPILIATPLEYACCGYSEQFAQKTFGKQNIICYGSIFKPLQWNMDEQKQEDCYAKIVVLKNGTKLRNQIIGIHYIGPCAGEIVQGFAISIKKGITKEDLQYTVGIHPTIAQQFVLLSAIAGSDDEKKTGC